MRVVHLSLADFRNYREAELPLQAGPNLLLGRNGQGKTNLIEAMGYFATLRSHRVTGDVALIRAGADSGIARMRVEALGREALLELQLNRDRANRAQVNRNGVKPRELTRWFSSVLFAPEDLSIVRGDPAGRRRFLDDALVSRMPSFAGVLSDYERVVRQRTSLLKSARGAGSAVEATLPVWDDQLIELGAQIMVARRELVSDLGRPLRSGYASLVKQDHSPTLGIAESMRSALTRKRVSRETGSASEVSDVSRETIGDVATSFRAALQEMRDQELERALTLVGPHRDDLLLGLNGLPVKGYASHGESWSFALSLKLALATLLREESPVGDPVIILDDVFAELDTRRRESLMAAVGDFEQVIVTAAVEDDVPGNVVWHRVWVESGRLVGEEQLSHREVAGLVTAEAPVSAEPAPGPEVTEGSGGEVTGGEVAGEGVAGRWGSPGEVDGDEAGSDRSGGDESDASGSLPSTDPNDLGGAVGGLGGRESGGDGFLHGLVARDEVPDRGHEEDDDQSEWSLSGTVEYDPAPTASSVDDPIPRAQNNSLAAASSVTDINGSVLESELRRADETVDPFTGDRAGAAESDSVGGSSADDEEAAADHQELSGELGVEFIDRDRQDDAAQWGSGQRSDDRS